MNIVVFYQYFGTPKGSWSTRIYELTRRWVAAGHNVTVVTAPYEKSDIRATKFTERQQVEGINLIVINSADSNRESVVKRAYRSLVFSLVAIYYALTLPADVVVASSGPITIGLPALFAKWFRGKKMIFEVRDLWPQGAIELGKIKSKTVIGLGRWFEKLCYKNSRLVVPCSKGMEDGVKKVYPAAKTLVITNASDAALFLKEAVTPSNFLPQLEGKKIFLYAGSLGLMDECSQIINGMSLITDHSVAMVFAGDGAERAHLEQMAAQSPNKNIFFLGLMPKNDVLKWFSVATATFVTFKDLSVLHTSSPNKMFDSFAAGKPIIQSTRGWIKDLVDTEMCGVNVDPNKAEDFANAILYMANNSEARDRMAANAKRLGETEFNRDRLAGVYLDGIKQVVNG